MRFDSAFCGLKLNLSYLFSFIVRASQPFSEKVLSPHAHNTSEAGLALSVALNREQ